MLMRLGFVLLSLLVCLSSVQAAVPRVVVSIAPVHSLVSGVMAGVGEPMLLVTGAASPHAYVMKPSQMRALHQADLVVWVGENVESFLPKVLETLGAQNKVVELADVNGMHLLPARRGGVWEADAHGGHDHGHAHGNMDGHLWLDPENARVIVNTLTDRLSGLDPANADRYRANAARMTDRLNSLGRVLEQTLAPVRQRPYLVFHDAYHYFEDRYGLNAVGAISVSPDRKPGARRLMEIRDRIVHQSVRCVFAEPQFPDNAVRIIVEGTRAKSAELDPMGYDLTPGADLYFELMRNLANGVRSCLQ